MLLKAIQVDYSNDELNLILHELIQFPEQYFDFMCLSLLFRPVQLQQSPSMFIATLCYPRVSICSGHNDAGKWGTSPKN